MGEVCVDLRLAHAVDPAEPEALELHDVVRLEPRHRGLNFGFDAVFSEYLR